MRNLLAISLSLLLFASCCKDVGTYISFYANQDFIAKVFCVNKDDAKSCCAGKCYLTKKLSNGKSDGDSQIPIAQNDIKQLQYIPVGTTEKITIYPNDVINFHLFYYQKLYDLSVIDDILRPPISV